MTAPSGRNDTFAVQIAKWLGARHCRDARRKRRCRPVHRRRRIIDHDAEDFTNRRERWDVIFDIGGNHPFSRCRRVMEPDGILVAVGGPAGRWLASADRLLEA